MVPSDAILNDVLEVNWNCW